MNQNELITLETTARLWRAAALPRRQVFPPGLAAGAAARKNPAGLSALLASVFPAGVVGAELCSAADPALLFPEEAQDLGRALPKRIQEFAAGRLCARRALAESGFTDYPLRMNSDRRPHWPASLIGSISHTSGMCGAVVASQRQFRAIGVDVESVGRVTSELWPIICTPEEMVGLATLRELERARCAALIFSAKEAFYKCQYHVTGQWLEFGDVTLDLFSSAARAGYFTVRPCKSITLLTHHAPPWRGRFQFHGGLVVTGIVIGAY